MTEEDPWVDYFLSIVKRGMAGEKATKPDQMALKTDVSRGGTKDSSDLQKPN